MEFEKSGSSSMIWLVLAYLFHTIGELCLSPVALSFITNISSKICFFNDGSLFCGDRIRE
jgi:dipeptide/tripeptide permease